MIKYIIQYNFTESLILFSHILIEEVELLEDPPYYVLITNEENKCFLGYMERIAEYNSCRVVSKMYDIQEVLMNSDKYILGEKEIKEVNIGDFKNIELNIRSLKEALELLGVIAPGENEYLFRGQADKDWKIESSLFRTGYNEERESTLFSEIRHMNHNQLNSEDFIQLSCDMQHYGIPTRLVDWTGNLLNAIYFSCVNGKEDLYKDGMVFASNCSEIIDVDSDIYSAIQAFLEYRYASTLDIVDGLFPILSKIYESEKKYIFFKTRFSNERVKRQNGYFSVCFEANLREANEFLKYQLGEYLKRNNSTVPDQVIDNLTAEIKIPVDDSVIDHICELVESYNVVLQEKIKIDDLNEALVRFRKIKPIYHVMDEIQNHDQHIKLIIPADYKLTIINELDKVGINSSTIYPDLDGMVKYIRERYSN